MSGDLGESHLAFFLAFLALACPVGAASWIAFSLPLGGLSILAGSALIFVAAVFGLWLAIVILAQVGRR